MKKAFCIYCGKEVDTSKGAGDHIIPATLGEFKNDKRFKNICQQCNTEIGKSEEQLLRCSPVRLFRDLVLPSTSRSRRNRLSWCGAQGVPPPKFLVNTKHGQVLGYPIENFLTLTNPDQLIIEDGKGESHFITLHPKMSAASLKKKVDSIVTEIDKTPPTRILCRVANTNHYTKIIREVWPNIKIELVSTEEPGYHKSKVEVSMVRTDHYFRAIAKIAFHYYLTRSDRAKGNEEGFAEIRRFIMSSGNGKAFFDCPKYFMDMESNMVPVRWYHSIAASEEEGEVIGYVRLCHGPEFKGLEHNIRLGQLSSKLVLPRETWGHQYKYYKPVPERGDVGSVCPLRLTRA